MGLLHCFIVVSVGLLMSILDEEPIVDLTDFSVVQILMIVFAVIGSMFNNTMGGDSYKNEIIKNISHSWWATSTGYSLLLIILFWSHSLSPLLSSHVERVDGCAMWGWGGGGMLVFGLGCFMNTKFDKLSSGLTYFFGRITIWLCIGGWVWWLFAGGTPMWFVGTISSWLAIWVYALLSTKVSPSIIRLSLVTISWLWIGSSGSRMIWGLI